MLSGVRYALVQGGTRGIGLETARLLVASPHVEKVFVTGRTATQPGTFVMDNSALSEKLIPLDVDTTSEQDIEKAAYDIRHQHNTDRLHFVLNASGFLHFSTENLMPERKITDVTSEMISRNFSVNAFAPILWAKYLSSFLKHKDPAVFASISARVGSISDNRMGGWYSYRSVFNGNLRSTMSLE